jgi:hypothetical protein
MALFVAAALSRDFRKTIENLLGILENQRRLF